ncbi:PD-(D/E)XK nuclease-like domain-containing protein [Zhihengliuella halotolerans]|uniref:PD-(D/E)XK nuclease-like domain-containing protein n=1 Tax=Zhihengliuella halotolerans TaxID=370736 RepID=UPI000C80507D|nr:PD-(D/E)XK nuclease-like domain-containing protein [Zhihengliuella halotolerans]
MGEVIDGLPATDYHKHEAIGSTSLKTLLKPGGPELYAWQRGRPIYKKEFDIGTAAHSLILEQDESAFAVVNADSWRTNAAKDARDEARERGLVPMLTGDYDRVRSMRDAVMAHPVAGPLLTGHVAERSYFTGLDGVPAKCRPDALHEHHGVAIDLKTCASTAIEKPAKTVLDIGYDLSAAYYVDIIQKETGFAPAWAWIFVEKEGPHRVRVVEPDGEFMRRGRKQYLEALDIYRECTANDSWPGFTETTTITPPAWAK